MGTRCPGEGWHDAAMASSIPTLRPLDYHRVIADRLAAAYPTALAALPGGGVVGDAGGELDESLLRGAYRLEEAGHAEVLAAVRAAAAALGVAVPVEVHVEEGRVGHAAELVFVPDRAVLVFAGDTLNLLTPAELTAVAGHELAHHLLWTAEGGRYLAVARLLEAAESDARTPPEYLTTARRYRLATELFADRGGLVAAGSGAPAVATAVCGLLKVATGLASVDPEAYLRQADRIDHRRPGQGRTHPETVVRAWALRQWDLLGDDAEAAVDRTLAPALDVAALDLADQERLLGLTRDVVAVALGDDRLASGPVRDLAREYGVEAPRWDVPPPDLGGPGYTAETRRYLAAVLLDLATAAPDGGHDVLEAAAALAVRAGVGEELKALVVAELDLAERHLARIFARARELADAAGNL